MPDRSSPDPAAAEILAAARRILPWMIEIRRDLHRHPELGLDEHRTSRRVQELLDGEGVEYRAGLAGTGVLGVLGGGHGRGRPGRGSARRPRRTAAPGRQGSVLSLGDSGPHARLRSRRAHRHSVRRHAPAAGADGAALRHRQADLPARRGDGRRRAAADPGRRARRPAGRRDLRLARRSRHGGRAR